MRGDGQIFSPHYLFDLSKRIVSEARRKTGVEAKLQYACQPPQYRQQVSAPQQ